MKLWTVAAALLPLTACTAGYRPAVTQTTLTDNTIVSRTAGLAHTYVLDRESRFVTCSEPTPDTGFDQGEDGNLNVSIVHLGGSDDIGNAETSQETELAGRTPSVLMARELFFRLCEFNRNYNMSSDQAKAMYLQTLDVVKSGWLLEAQNTKVNIGDSVVDSTTSDVRGNVQQPTAASTTATTTSSTTTDANNAPVTNTTTNNTGSSNF